MNRSARIFLVSFLILCSDGILRAQGTLEDYRRAERFLADEVKKLAFSGEVRPSWIEGTSRFWYVNDGPTGKEFMLADSARATREPAFDHEKLAAALSRAVGKPYAARALPFDTIRFGADGSIRVIVEQVSWTCDLAKYECARSKDQAEAEEAQPGRPPRAERPSPDRRFSAFVRDHNVWVRVQATGEQIQLSRDGERFYDYATPLPSPTLMVQQGTEDVVQAPAVFWSPDSKKIATYVMDQRGLPAPDHGAVRAAGPVPSEVVQLCLPAARSTTRCRRSTARHLRRRAPAADPGRAPALTMLVLRRAERRVGRRQRALPVSRSHSRVHARPAAPGRRGHGRRRGPSSTSATRRWSDTYLLVSRAFNGGARGHLVLGARRLESLLSVRRRETATLKNRLTRGEWVIRSIERVDEKARILYFTASGREPGRDPYLRHLYRVNLDGTGLTLLTPEDADHDVSFSSDGAYFVDRVLARRSPDGVGGPARRGRHA